MDSESGIKENTRGALRERIKELSCLYHIAHLATQTNLTMDEMLMKVVEGLPPAWLYPEAASAKIVLDGHIYPSRNYRRGNYRQRVPVLIGGKRRGYIEVSYYDDRPDQDEGPFLNEERHLLEAVAKEVAIIIMHKEDEEAKAKMQEQLRHADRLATVGQLAAGVAHELNEPLGHILGFAQLAHKCPGLPGQAKADIDKILNTSLYTREIVRKLLMFSRQIPPQKCRVDVNHIIDEVLSFLDSQCASNGITVNFQPSAGLPEINADPSQLKQVFVNLIVNAVQAMPGGGKLSISTQRDSEMVRIIVDDTGPGMNKDILRNVFTPFFTTKPVGLGTGLGLPVAHGIITSHQGIIKIESQPGKGTTCTVELPLRNGR